MIFLQISLTVPLFCRQLQVMTEQVSNAKLVYALQATVANNPPPAIIPDNFRVT
jgi:hypothetical protein